jgi:hypothetical protein
MPPINAAALAAALVGDLENFLAAATPGGIEQQEAQGQAQMVAAFNTLPKRILNHAITYAMLEQAWGIAVGADQDDIFVKVAFPAGWAMRPTSHNMHSDLLDATGTCRAGIFYKAAFYDRSASLRITPRYAIHNDYGDPLTRVTVVDHKTTTVLLECGSPSAKDYTAMDASEQEADRWLTEHFPNFADPLAYWNDHVERA